MGVVTASKFGSAVKELLLEFLPGVPHPSLLNASAQGCLTCDIQRPPKYRFLTRLGAFVGSRARAPAPRPRRRRAGACSRVPSMPLHFALPRDDPMALTVCGHHLRSHTIPRNLGLQRTFRSRLIPCSAS